MLGGAVESGEVEDGCDDDGETAEEFYGQYSGKR